MAALPNIVVLFIAALSVAMSLLGFKNPREK